MNRKKFIESVGATCANWTWSWSFVNHEQSYVIFGAWTDHDSEQSVLILHPDWEYSAKGRIQPGYGQALEHIGLIVNNGYALRTFPMERDLEADPDGPAIIKSFRPILSVQRLKMQGSAWYALEPAQIADEPEPAEEVPSRVFMEGAVTTITVNAYERSGKAREACINYWGYVCRVCQFDFEAMYGDQGKEYCHVHHIKPLSETGQNYEVDPINDLVPVCPNCHAMIHRGSDTLSLEGLRQIIAAQRARLSPTPP